MTKFYMLFVQFVKKGAKHTLDGGWVGLQSALLIFLWQIISSEVMSEDAAVTGYVKAASLSFHVNAITAGSQI